MNINIICIYVKNVVQEFLYAYYRRHWDIQKKKKKNNIVVVPPSHLGVVLLELASPGSVNFVTVKSGTYSVDPGSRSKRLPPSHLGDVLL